VDVSDLLKKMQLDWDERARENARFYIVDSRQNWTEDEFYRLGQQTVAQEILTDMYNVCQGKEPQEMKVLEIGCGAGRVTRSLADLFGEVHAVDVSGEMVGLAQAACAHKPNAFIYQNNGMDLQVVGDRVFDFAFSICCFHHIPSRDIIENYVREVGRILRPGALFKFEVQGYVELDSKPDDTWYGIPFSDSQAVAMAGRCGFEPRHRIGAGEERFWLWFFKK
jgi:ubiquinone/menaquinone biosynthesis C-methylase UbiE